MKILGKIETHFGNCILTPNGYKCFGCGGSGNIIQLVMEELNILILSSSCTIINMNNCTEYKEELDRSYKIKHDGNFYNSYTEERYRLDDLFSENKDLFYFMVKNKALEGIEKREKYINLFCKKECEYGVIFEFGFKTNTLELQRNIESIWLKEIRVLKDILTKFWYKHKSNIETEIPDLYHL